MSYLKKIFLLLLLWVGSPFILFAQRTPKLARVEPFGFHFKKSYQHYAKVPFESHANLIVVKVNIDKSDTLRFILDTGVSSTIITDPQIAKKMGLVYSRSVKISGAGEGQALSAAISLNHTLQMGDVRAVQQNLVVINEDFLHLSEFLGIPVHGIFGHDIFSAFVVTIDWENKSLYLYEPSKFKYKKAKGEKYPIVITQSKPYTDAFAMVNNDKNIPMRLVIDTGAGHALLLNSDKNQPIQLPQKVIRANLGRGLNGDINGMIGRVDELKLGSIELKNIIASFPDSLSFSMKFPPDTLSRQGSIGCELLRRFKVTFNYHDGYMVLKPIRDKMKESFEHDMSGMEIKAKGQAFNQYVVDRVTADSPADKAGIKEQDELIFINNQHVRELTISEIYRLLARKEGKEIELFFRRKGELKFAYFNLKRMI